MKLQAASKKEISRIAVGTLVCDGIMVAALFLLSEFGIGTFSKEAYAFVDFLKEAEPFPCPVFCWARSAAPW